MFFTAPPLDVPRVPGGAGVLGHSLKYLAKKARDAEGLAEKRGERDGKVGEEAGEKRKRGEEEEERRAEEVKRLKARAIEELNRQIEKGTERVYEELYDGDAKVVMEEERLRLGRLRAEEEQKIEIMERHAREREESKVIRLQRVGL